MGRSGERVWRTARALVVAVRLIALRVCVSALPVKFGLFTKPHNRASGSRQQAAGASTSRFPDAGLISSSYSKSSQTSEVSDNLRNIRE